MIEHIKALLNGDDHLGKHADAANVVGELQAAVAALLIEAARLDGDYGASERKRIEVLLADRFSLSPEALATLMKTATQLSDDAVDSYEFTSQIARKFDHEERIGIVEMLWDVAYADGSVHPYEANLLRRVAGLLYVTDQESGAARKRVVARNGVTPDGDDGH